jgi:hypothetical protein
MICLLAGLALYVSTTVYEYRLLIKARVRIVKKYMSDFDVNGKKW